MTVNATIVSELDGHAHVRPMGTCAASIAVVGRLVHVLLASVRTCLRKWFGYDGSDLKRRYEHTLLICPFMPHVKHTLLIGQLRVKCSSRAPHVRHLMR